MQVRSRETSAETLIKTLRELPNKEALALRSEVAMQVGCCMMRRVSECWELICEQSLAYITSPSQLVTCALALQAVRHLQEMLLVQAAAAKTRRRLLEKSIWNIAKRDI